MSLTIFPCPFTRFDTTSSKHTRINNDFTTYPNRDIFDYKAQRSSS